MFGTTPRGLVSEWIARLTARLTIARDEIRRSIVEAVSRTVAEAAEGTLIKLIGHGQPPVESMPQPVFEPRWDNYEDEDDYDLEPEEPAVAPAKRRWKVFAVAALHGLAWWLPRQCTSPVVATAAAIVGAVVLLLD